MKTLGKFKINPEKVINNEELVNLRGGAYGENNVFCECYPSGTTFEYADCSCDQEQMDRNIFDTCAPEETGSCLCNPCT